MSGGELCLDLVNTVENRPRGPRELLNTYRDLVSWAEQARVLAPEQARRLLRAAARRPAAAEVVLRRAHALREGFFALFSALARRRPLSPGALAPLQAALPGTLVRQELRPRRRGFAWDWAREDALDRMLWPVVRSAADLLTSPRRERVRECAAERCAWLFLDASKNASRRWCDMAVCGNRAKARRHYQRKKTVAGRA